MSGERPRPLLLPQGKGHGLLAAVASALAQVGRIPIGMPPVDDAVPAPQSPGEQKKAGRKARLPAGQATTMPKDPRTGECINPARRHKKAIAAAFLERTGRKMNPKDWKRLRREAENRIPSEMDVAAMFSGKHGQPPRQ